MSAPLILEAEQLHTLLQSTGLQDTEKLLILDLCSPNSYQQGHVPGAIYVNPLSLIHGGQPAPGKLPEISQLQALFSALGLTPETQVVAYDDEGGGWAGRMIWTLDMIGHTQSSYLNGGIHAWRAAALPEEQKSIAPEPSSLNIKLSQQASRYSVDKDDILALLGAGNTLIWDARSPAEYSGEKILAAKGGHIPGAINCEWTQLMDAQNQLRIRTDAKQFLAQQGIDENSNIITHCQSHHRSGFTYLVGKALGFNIRAYPGSWSEWGNLEDTPVEV